jgi:hypothetical protein
VFRAIGPAGYSPFEKRFRRIVPCPAAAPGSVVG